jgi:hypothetical protein
MRTNMAVTITYVLYMNKHSCRSNIVLNSYHDRYCPLLFDL